MNIAVIGSGISGLTASYYLSQQHRVALFEAGDYAGGHTDTHSIDIAGQCWQVDSGFIVFNEKNYPNFCQLLDDLKVQSQPTDMSFSVSDPLGGLEYNATSLDKLFCQRRNMVSGRFYRMLFDLVRFYRQAPVLLEQQDDALTLGDYLKENGYSTIFIEQHLIPMACALWSGPSVSIQQFPARYFVQFMYNHHMLSLTGRPQWRVVKGGSNSYVQALLQTFPGEVHLCSPVQQIQRDELGVTLLVNGQQHHFDRVVLATHSDQALAMLQAPSAAEKSVLGAIGYQQNSMVLHSDSSVLPVNRKAWACWNARLGSEMAQQCTVSYHMNQLQRLDGAPVEFIVSLNCDDLIDPGKIFARRHYSHPVYNTDTLAAQQRWSEISGYQHTYYCGAYWGWGFHEDGVNSALRVVSQFNADAEVQCVA